MPSAKELRDQLRDLRKDTVKPVSKMRKEDVSAEIQRLRGAREETPAVAAVPSTKAKAMKSTVETIKEAKAMEFPTAPMGADTKKKSGKSPMVASKDSSDDGSKKKKSKKDMLKALMAAMESSDSE